MTTGSQFQARNQREAILVLARAVEGLKDNMADDCDTINLRLENIEGHLLDQQRQIDKNGNRLTRLETLGSILGGVIPLILGIVTKLNDTWPWR